MQQQIILKSCFLGSSGVGKTCIVTRLLNKKFNEFTDSTMGASFTNKKYIIDNNDFRLDIWDTAGQERFNTLIKMYYRNADIVIVCYDITNKDSFIRAQNLIKEVRTHEDSYIILLGNKFDYADSRQVEFAEVQSYAELHDIFFIEISAKSNYNINKLDDIIIEIFKKKINKYNSNNDILADNSSSINIINTKTKSKIRKLFWCFNSE